MLTILIGLAIQLVFFIMFAGAFYSGYRLHKYKVSLQSTKEEIPTIDELTKRKEEQMRKDFEAVMSYDIDTAMGTKRGEWT